MPYFVDKFGDTALDIPHYYEYKNITYGEHKIPLIALINTDTITKDKKYIPIASTPYPYYSVIIINDKNQPQQFIHPFFNTIFTIPIEFQPTIPSFKETIIDKVEDAILDNPHVFIPLFAISTVALFFFILYLSCKL